MARTKRQVLPSRRLKDVEDTLHHETTSIKTDDETQPPLLPPPNWDPAIEYLSQPIQSTYLNERQRKWLCHKVTSNVSSDINKQATTDEQQDLPTIKLPLSRTEVSSRIGIRLINDPDHPAHSQRGLFATRDLAPGDLILPYIGYVHSSTVSERTEQARQQQSQDSTAAAQRTDTDGAGDSVWHDPLSAATQPLKSACSDVVIGSWDTSSYDLNLHRDDDIELAIDAAQMGNEARFCNDYRGVPAFDDPGDGQGRWDRKSKRSAKSWVYDGAEMKSSDALGGEGRVLAIPNAEFRDVWFELPAKDEGLMAAVPDMSPRGCGAEDIADRVAMLDMGRDQVVVDCDSMASTSNRSEMRQGRGKRRPRKNGMRGVAIFVLPAGKSGKRKHGVRTGQEILVSYGKGFWAHHAIESEGG